MMIPSDENLSLPDVDNWRLPVKKAVKSCEYTHMISDNILHYYQLQLLTQLATVTGLYQSTEYQERSVESWSVCPTWKLKDKSQTSFSAISL